MGRAVLPALGFVLLAAVGCAAPAPPTGPTELVVQLSDYEAFVDATLTTLRRNDFHPDFVDRARGVITTSRTTGAQWFEFWRTDVHGGYQTLESSISTIGRTVNVHIEPLDAVPGTTPPVTAAAITTNPAPAPPDAPPPTTQEAEEFVIVDQPPAPPKAGRFRLTVQVDKTRFSAPDRQITTGAAALRLYSKGTPTEEGLVGTASTKVEWVPLGRDALAESYLLAKLIEQNPGLEYAE